MSGSNEKYELTKILAQAQLPALPQSAVRLLELAKDPDHGPFQYAIPIESDPGLTSQVLRFVNSSYFAFRQEISSIQLAISLVGIRTIKNFALWNAVFSVLPNPQCGAFSLKNLWQDSLRRGLFARLVAKQLRLAEAEDLFAMALLQDMAIPLLAREKPTDYQQLLVARENGAHRLSDLEREHFGWTHAEAGGFLARGWRLPESFAAAIEQHTTGAWAEDRGATGPQIVGLSALLPATCDADWPEREAFLSSLERALGSEAEAMDVLTQVDRDFHEFAPVLKITQPAKSLAAYLEPATAS